MSETRCTAERPDPTARIHPDAKCVFEEYGGLSGGGDYEYYECPHCQLRFWAELPD